VRAGGADAGRPRCQAAAAVTMEPRGRHLPGRAEATRNGPAGVPPPPTLQVYGCAETTCSSSSRAGVRIGGSVRRPPPAWRSGGIAYRAGRGAVRTRVAALARDCRRAADGEPGMPSGSHGSHGRSRTRRASGAEARNIAGRAVDWLALFLAWTSARRTTTTPQGAFGVWRGPAHGPDRVRAAVAPPPSPTRRPSTGRSDGGANAFPPGHWMTAWGDLRAPTPACCERRSMANDVRRGGSPTAPSGRGANQGGPRCPACPTKPARGGQQCP